MVKSTPKKNEEQPRDEVTLDELTKLRHRQSRAVKAHVVTGDLISVDQESVHEVQDSDRSK
jgi:hypothetical protein